jgi:hypothetical protein
MLDFNRSNLSSQPLCLALNDLIERNESPGENVRHYLGASSIGSECLRKIQYDWWVDPVHLARFRDIFARGHFFEGVMRQHLLRVGFKFAPSERLEFIVADGYFQGHADGILVAGPDLPDLRFPCLWECKCLKAKGWKAIERDGLTGLYETYAAQVAIYQAYLNVTDHPALFSVINADTCEQLHFQLPFDAARAQAWSDRAVMVIEATRAGELLERITDNPDDWRCKMCSHRARCWSLPENTERGGIYRNRKQSVAEIAFAPAPSTDLSIPDFLRRIP